MEKIETDNMNVIEHIRADAEEGARRLEREYKDRLLKVANRLCQDPVEAEALVWRTLDEAVRHIESLVDPDALFGWMCGIMVRGHGMANRRKINSKIMYSDSLPEMPDGLEGVDRIVQGIDGDILHKAIEDLPPKLKETIILRYFMDLPLLTIAKILMIPKGTVSSRLDMARKLLALRLGVNLKKPAVAMIAAGLLLLGATAAVIVGVTEMAGEYESSVNNQLPSANYQQPSNSYQPPSTNNQLKGENEVNIKQKAATAFAAATLALTPFASAQADVDSLGKTPTYWYTFDGAIVSHGSSALKCAFDDSNNTFLTCRGEKKGWRVNPNKSYHHENVFAPNNGSFTIFLSVNPGSGQSNRYIFSLGGNESTTNLAFVLMFNNRIGVARWDRTRCGTNLRAYGLMATDGVAGRVHPYALVYDGTAHRLTLYSGGVACAEAPFEGFDGADGDPTKFQFGSVHGGRVLPFSTIPSSGSVAEGLPVIEDFRFYNEALSAEQVASISAELPSTWTESEASAVGTIENNGEQPRYFYTFDGAVRSRGTSQFIDSYSAEYPAHKIPSVSSYVECAPDRKAGALSDTPHGDWFVQSGGSFTLFVSSTSGTTDQNIIFDIGQHTSTKNLALVRQSATQVKIVKWNSSASIQTLVTATVDSPADYVHPYVVRYRQDTGKIELFVDGYKAGEYSYAGLDTDNPTAFQFGAMRGGNLHGLKTYTGVNMEAIGFYERALTDEEIVALSDKYVSGSGTRIPSDIGRNPEYWYTFTSSGPMKQSTAALPLGASNNGTLIYEANSSPAFARNGGFAATDLRANSNGTISGAYGSSLDMSGPFTLFMSARMKSVANTLKLLFTLGGLTDSDVNLAISADLEGNMRLSRWNYSAKTRTDLIKAEGIADITDYHPYAVVWDGSVLRFYVDGTEAGTSSNFGNVTQKKFQIGSINGGIPSDRFGFSVGTYALEDFRIYKTALTAEQVAKISARYAQWPKGALVWGGGSAGSWDYTTSCWLSWDAANWRSVTQAFTSGASALFESEVTALDVAEGIVADSVKFFANSYWTTVNNVRCNSLLIGDGALVLPANVTSGLRPGRRLFKGYLNVSYPVDYCDSYGNVYYQNISGTALRFGKGDGGMVISVK